MKNQKKSLYAWMGLCGLIAMPFGAWAQTSATSTPVASFFLLTHAGFGTKTDHD